MFTPHVHTTCAHTQAWVHAPLLGTQIKVSIMQYVLIPHNKANYAHCFIPIMLLIYICHAYTCVHMFVCTLLKMEHLHVLGMFQHISWGYNQ